MDPSHGPDMTLSIGSPAFNTDIHGVAALMLKPPHHELAQTPWWDVSNNSRGSKRKRGKTDTLPRTEISGLSFQNDRAAGLSSTNPSPGSSTGSRTTTGSMLVRGITEEGPPMSLGLGLTGLSSHGFSNGCIAPSIPGVRLMPTSSDMGMHQFAKMNPKPGIGTNVLLGLGPLHGQSINDTNKGHARKGINAIDHNGKEHDLGMQLQLGLSNNSTVISEDHCVSYMSFAQRTGSTCPDNRNENVGIELNLVADDEGSTSARRIKAGGYIPSLLMGRRPDDVPLREKEGEEQDSAAQINFVHQFQRGELSLGNTNKARKLDDMLVSVKTLSGNTTYSGPSLTADRASKTCKFRGCGKGARGASGLCITHGGGRRCQRQGCHKGAEGRTVYCKSHGGGRRCQSLGCTKSAEGKTDYCISHGGGRRCSQDGCSKAARGRSGLCIRHGGGKRCHKEGCTKSAEGYSGLCISHGGGRRCQAEGCKKGAQGSTMFCKAHGGGKRCMIQGCTKGAEGSTPLCKGHGGGKRCMFDGGGICTKSVHGGTSFCVAHGGGKRCAVEGCTKSARGRTSFCVKHGGGKRCKFEDCTKSAQGSTDFCKAHGGGKRCFWGQEGSPYMEFANDKTSKLFKGPCDRFARGKIGLCAAHSALVQDRRVHGAGTIGSALPAGIGPGLFRGLVTCTGSTDKNFGESVSTEVSKQSTQGSEECGEYGSESGGPDSLKRGGANTNAGLYKNQVVYVEHDSQHAHSFPETSLGCNAGLLFAGNNLIITRSQSMSSSMTSAGAIIPNNGNMSSSMTSAGAIIPNNCNMGLWAGASLPSACKANHKVSMTTGSFHSPNFSTAVNNAEAPAVGSCLMGERRALLPPQVLVPLSMQKGQFLPSHGRDNMKQTRSSYAGESGTSKSPLSLCEERVHGGDEKRVHGGSFLALLSGNHVMESA